MWNNVGSYAEMLKYEDMILYWVYWPCPLPCCCLICTFCYLFCTCTVKTEVCIARFFGLYWYTFGKSVPMDTKKACCAHFSFYSGSCKCYKVAISLFWLTNCCFLQNGISPHQKNLAKNCQDLVRLGKIQDKYMYSNFCQNLRKVFQFLARICQNLVRYMKYMCIPISCQDHNKILIRSYIRFFAGSERLTQPFSIHMHATNQFTHS